MSSALALGALLALGAELPDTEAQGTELARVCRVPARAGCKLRELALHDIDGDGQADLVVSLSGPKGARWIETRLRQATAPSFAPAPSASLELPRDVVAWAVADVHADPGDELVLFSSGAVFAARLGAKESERFVKLATIDFLWQYPDPRGAFSWQDGVLDVDHDGLEDLLVPGPGVERVLFQRRDAQGTAHFEVSAALAVGESQRALASKSTDAIGKQSGKRRMSVSFGDDGLSVDTEKRSSGRLVTIDDTVPAGAFHDWDGDGDLDALFLTERALLVYRQEPRGSFLAQPLVLESPIVRDRSRELDLSFDAWSRDLDGDGRVDVLFSAGDKRSKDARTQVLAFLQGGPPADPWKSEAHPLFGTDGTPRQVLVLAGFARPLALTDVDGDGRLDLVALSLAPDLIDKLRSATSEQLEAELYVFRGAGAAFEKKPALVRRVSLPARGGGPTLSFAGDLTGDGVAELFTRDDPTHLRAWLVRRGKDATLTVADRALWELTLAEGAEIVLPDHLGKGAWDVLSWTGEEIVCSSFR